MNFYLYFLIGCLSAIFKTLLTRARVTDNVVYQGLVSGVVNCMFAILMFVDGGLSPAERVFIFTVAYTVGGMVGHVIGIKFDGLNGRKSV